MRTLLTLAFIGFCSLVFAQKSETRALPSKPIGISVSTGIQATLIKSNKNEVVLQAASSGQLNRMEAKIEHGVLVIRIKRNSNFQNSKSLKATIYINSNLESIDLSSAASLAIKEPLDATELSDQPVICGIPEIGHPDSQQNQSRLKLLRQFLRRCESQRAVHRCFFCLCGANIGILHLIEHRCKLQR